MLKGQVFAKQLFENQIFALFVNTFLNGNNGVSDNYADGMEVTYSGSNVTIGAGAVCIQGRFLEEDTSTTLSAGTSNNYCKLVIEIDLDKTNTESDFEQGYYRILTSSTGYPALTQSDIVKNNAGVYQYELARFRTTSSGITDFVDKRTFLDFSSIYDEIRQHIQDIDDGDVFLTKTGGSTTGVYNFDGQVKCDNVTKANGSSYINNDQIHIINASVTIPAHQVVTATASYPEGLTADNCIPLAVGVKYVDNKGYNYFGQYRDSASLANNAYSRYINLAPSNLQVTLYNDTDSSKTLSFRIVLLDIS